MSSTDQHWMRLAIELAAHGEGFVEPNPMVGCVLVHNDKAIGQGYHQRFGGPHAEVEALNQWSESKLPADTTAYVTLEPCCHHGKTPPCSRALIDSGVSRVVVAMRDPFPKVDGGGIKQLRAAGIQVDVGVLEDTAREQNAPYLKRVTTGMPWVIAKWAMTLDGKIATVSGDSQWITNTAARREVHLLRGRVDAIAVGMGTVVEDDPMLNARQSEEPINQVVVKRVAQRVVFCRNRLPAVESKLAKSAEEYPTRCFVAPSVDSSQRDQLRECGVNITPLGSDDPSEMIDDALRFLGKQGMTNLMVEGGGDLLASFLGDRGDRCQIDECHVYLGGKIFGGRSAKTPVGGSGIRDLADAPHFQLFSMKSFDGDVRLIYRLRTEGRSIGT